MQPPRLTPHQKDTLLTLARRSMLLATERPGRFVFSKDCGGPAALDHLVAKGYAEREYRPGPRGGEHYYYRPTGLGYEVVTRETVKNIRERCEPEMSLFEVELALVQAREEDKIVRVFVGPTKAEIRSYVGEDYIDAATGLRRVRFGQQQAVAVAGIAKVEVER